MPEMTPISVTMHLDDPEALTADDVEYACYVAAKMDGERYLFDGCVCIPKAWFEGNVPLEITVHVPGRNRGFQMPVYIGEAFQDGTQVYATDNIGEHITHSDGRIGGALYIQQQIFNDWLRPTMLTADIRIVFQEK